MSFFKRRQANNSPQTNSSPAYGISDSQHFQMQGQDLKRQGKFQQSKEAYYHAIQLDPSDVMAYYGLAKTCYVAGDQAETMWNLMSAMHLSFSNIIDAIKQGGNNYALEWMFLNNSLDETIKRSFSSIHPYAALVLLDPNTPRHIGHALVDLDRNIPKSKKLESHIKRYHDSLMGKDSSEPDGDIKEAYIIVGRHFALDNLSWGQLHNKNPYSLYGREQQWTMDISPVRDLLALS